MKLARLVIALKVNVSAPSKRYKKGSISISIGLSTVQNAAGKSL